MKTWLNKSVCLSPDADDLKTFAQHLRYNQTNRAIFHKLHQNQIHCITPAGLTLLSAARWRVFICILWTIAALHWNYGLGGSGWWRMAPSKSTPLLAGGPACITFGDGLWWVVLITCSRLLTFRPRMTSDGRPPTADIWTCSRGTNIDLQIASHSTIVSKDFFFSCNHWWLYRYHFVSWGGFTSINKACVMQINLSRWNRLLNTTEYWCWRQVFITSPLYDLRMIQLVIVTCITLSANSVLLFHYAQCFLVGISNDHIDASQDIWSLLFVGLFLMFGTLSQCPGPCHSLPWSPLIITSKHMAV